MAFLDGYKTIIAGVGLIALGVYQASTGDHGLATATQGLAALGIRRAITTAAPGGLR